MKISKDFIISSISFIIDNEYDENEDGYRGCQKFETVDSYEDFLRENLEDIDYKEFRDIYTEFLKRNNLKEPADFYDDDIKDEESELCDSFGIHILRKYVIDYSQIRERKLNNIFKK